MSRRIEQVNALLAREIGVLLLREVEFPKGAFVTITRVVTAGDLRTATVSVSLFPVPKRGTLLTILQKQRGHLRMLLSRRLTLQHIPRFSFALDEEATTAAAVEDLLDNIKQER